MKVWISLDPDPSCKENYGKIKDSDGYTIGSFFVLDTHRGYDFVHVSPIEDEVVRTLLVWALQASINNSSIRTARVVIGLCLQEYDHFALDSWIHEFAGDLHGVQVINSESTHYETKFSRKLLLAVPNNSESIVSWIKRLKNWKPNLKGDAETDDRD